VDVSWTSELCGSGSTTTPEFRYIDVDVRRTPFGRGVQVPRLRGPGRVLFMGARLIGMVSVGTRVCAVADRTGPGATPALVPRVGLIPWARAGRSPS
jgi:hypothetical protein